MAFSFLNLGSLLNNNNNYVIRPKSLNVDIDCKSLTSFIEKAPISPWDEPEAIRLLSYAKLRVSSA